MAAREKKLPDALPATGPRRAGQLSPPPHCVQLERGTARLVRAMHFAGYHSQPTDRRPPAAAPPRLAVVRPVQDHTKLAIDEEGLRAIRRFEGPVVPVVVIGPYRSGKSFLLNQLLGVGCSEAPYTPLPNPRQTHRQT
jgi:Guanylate-binding protein, N-terminal domain